MAEKKYLDLEGLGIFKGKLDVTYSKVGHHHKWDDGTLDGLQDKLNTKIDTVITKKASTDQSPVTHNTLDGTINLNAATFGIDDSLIGVKQEAMHVALADKATNADHAADSAKLAQTVRISLSGDATGSTDFDGSTSVTIPVVVDPAQHQHTIDQVTDLRTQLGNKLETSLKGKPNGLAELGDDGKVPQSQLPSYVDDVLEFKNLEDFPPQEGKEYTDRPELGGGLIKPEPNKIYVAIDTNLTYRWGGSSYVVITSSLALGSTSGTAWYGEKGLATQELLGTYADGAGAKTAFGRIKQAEEDLAAEVTARTEGDSALQGKLDTTNSTVGGIRTDLGTKEDAAAADGSAFARITKLQDVQATKADKTVVEGIRSDLGTKPQEGKDAFTSIKANADAIGAEALERGKLNAILTGFGDNGGTPEKNAATVSGWVEANFDRQGHTHTASEITDFTEKVTGVVATKAASADKLNTDAGSTMKPVYFENGIPKEIGYTIQTSVPTNAVFTDTTYEDVLPNGGVSGLMTAKDKAKLDAIEAEANKYIHATHPAHAAGLYVTTVDKEGHVSAAVEAQHKDISALESVYTLTTGTDSVHANGDATDPYVNLYNSTDGKVTGKVQVKAGDNVTVKSNGGTITIAASDMRYTHPTYTEIGTHAAPVFHKIHVDTKGHVEASAAVKTSDIFALNELADASTPEKKIANQVKADNSHDGLMSKEYASKLDGITAGAAVISIAGKKGEVTLADIGLDKVNNIADADKVVKSAGVFTTPPTITIQANGIDPVSQVLIGNKNVTFDLTIESITTDDINALFAKKVETQATENPVALKSRRR